MHSLNLWPYLSFVLTHAFVQLGKTNYLHCLSFVEMNPLKCFTVDEKCSMNNQLFCACFPYFMMLFINLILKNVCVCVCVLDLRIFWNSQLQLAMGCSLIQDLQVLIKLALGIIMQMSLIIDSPDVWPCGLVCCYQLHYEVSSWKARWLLACLLYSQVFVVNDPVYILLYVNMSLKDSL